MDEIQTAKLILLNDKMPIAKKMRALFTLRNIPTDESVHIISQAFSSKSVLLKHELAYVLGQMRNKNSLNVLISVLENEDEDEIVRHEAGEALGNFLDESLIHVLEKFLNHKSIPLRETCFLAVNKIQARSKGDIASPFYSYDPAYPLNEDIKSLEKIFLDSNECFYKRYAAMFALRDLKSEEAVHILGKGFDDESSLFKHEIAFVMGQMRMAVSMQYLKKAMERETEHGMVRHECAEALGALGTEDAKSVLMPYINSKVDILRESVEVALDIHDYETGNEAEYCVV